MGYNPLAQPIITFTEARKIHTDATKRKREDELRKANLSERLIKLLMKSSYSPLQILVFDYLGFLADSQINLPKNKKNILLSIIFKTEGFENIRKMLSQIENYRTNENLLALKDLFTELNLTNPLNKVNEHLRIINSRKVVVGK